MYIRQIQMNEYCVPVPVQFFVKIFQKNGSMQLLQNKKAFYLIINI